MKIADPLTYLPPMRGEPEFECLFKDQAAEEEDACALAKAEAALELATGRAAGGHAAVAGAVSSGDRVLKINDLPAPQPAVTVKIVPVTSDDEGVDEAEQLEDVSLVNPTLGDTGGGGLGTVASREEGGEGGEVAGLEPVIDRGPLAIDVFPHSQPALMVGGSDVQSNRMGMYTIQEFLHEDRPYYRKVDEEGEDIEGVMESGEGENYLYYRDARAAGVGDFSSFAELYVLDKVNAGKWVVGSHLGASKFGLFVDDTAVTPLGITVGNYWRGYDTGMKTWMQEKTVRVQVYRENRDGTPAAYDRYAANEEFDDQRRRSIQQEMSNYRSRRRSSVGGAGGDRRGSAVRRGRASVLRRGSQAGLGHSKQISHNVHSHASHHARGVVQREHEGPETWVPGLVSTAFFLTKETQFRHLQLLEKERLEIEKLNADMVVPPPPEDPPARTYLQRVKSALAKAVAPLQRIARKFSTGPSDLELARILGGGFAFHLMFLRLAALYFIVASAIALPVLSLYYAGGGIPIAEVDYFGLARFSLGNIGVQLEDIRFTETEEVTGLVGSASPPYVRQQGNWSAGPSIVVPPQSSVPYDATLDEGHSYALLDSGSKPTDYCANYPDMCNGRMTAYRTMVADRFFSTPKVTASPTPAPTNMPTYADCLCTNECEFANDGTCDDGGPGSLIMTTSTGANLNCDFGTDCNDCGSTARSEEEGKMPGEPCPEQNTLIPTVSPTPAPKKTERDEGKTFDTDAEVPYAAPNPIGAISIGEATYMMVIMDFVYSVLLLLLIGYLRYMVERARKEMWGGQRLVHVQQYAVFVQGLPQDVTEDRLRAFFSERYDPHEGHRPWPMVCGFLGIRAPVVPSNNTKAKGDSYMQEAKKLADQKDKERREAMKKRGIKLNDPNGNKIRTKAPEFAIVPAGWYQPQTDITLQKFQWGQLTPVANIDYLINREEHDRLKRMNARRTSNVSLYQSSTILGKSDARQKLEMGAEEAGEKKEGAAGEKGVDGGSDKAAAKVPEISHPYPGRYLNGWVHEVVLAYDNPHYINTFRSHFEMKQELIEYEKKLNAIEVRQKYKMEEGTRDVRERERKRAKEKEDENEKAIEKEREQFNVFDEKKEEAEYEARKAAKKVAEEAKEKDEVIHSCMHAFSPSLPLSFSLSLSLSLSYTIHHTPYTHTPYTHTPYTHTPYTRTPYTLHRRTSCKRSKTRSMHGTKRGGPRSAGSSMSLPSTPLQRTMSGVPRRPRRPRLLRLRRPRVCRVKRNGSMVRECADALDNTALTPCMCFIRRTRLESRS
jgi:hypothetical protein